MGTEWPFGTVDDTCRHVLVLNFSSLAKRSDGSGAGIPLALEPGMYEQDDAQLEDLFDGIDAAETWEYATDDELDSY